MAQPGKTGVDGKDSATMNVSVMIEKIEVVNETNIANCLNNLPQENSFSGNHHKGSGSSVNYSQKNFQAGGKKNNSSNDSTTAPTQNSKHTIENKASALGSTGNLLGGKLLEKRVSQKSEINFIGHGNSEREVVPKPGLFADAQSSGLVKKSEKFVKTAQKEKLKNSNREFERNNSYVNIPYKGQGIGRGANPLMDVPSKEGSSGFNRFYVAGSSATNGSVYQKKSKNPNGFNDSAVIKKPSHLLDLFNDSYSNKYIGVNKTVLDNRPRKVGPELRSPERFEKGKLKTTMRSSITEGFEVPTSRNFVAEKAKNVVPNHENLVPSNGKNSAKKPSHPKTAINKNLTKQFDLTIASGITENFKAKPQVRLSNQEYGQRPFNASAVISPKGNPLDRMCSVVKIVEKTSTAESPVGYPGSSKHSSEFSNQLTGRYNNTKKYFAMDGNQTQFSNQGRAHLQDEKSPDSLFNAHDYNLYDDGNAKNVSLVKAKSLLVENPKRFNQNPAKHNQRNEPFSSGVPHKNKLNNSMIDDRLYMTGSDIAVPSQNIESDVVVVNAQKPAKTIDFFGQRDVSVGSRNNNRQIVTRKYSVTKPEDTKTSKFITDVAGSSVNVQQNFRKVNNGQPKWSINDAPKGFFDVPVQTIEEDTQFKFYNSGNDSPKKVSSMATAPTLKIYSNGGHTYERSNLSYNYPNVPNSPKGHIGQMEVATRISKNSSMSTYTALQNGGYRRDGSPTAVVEIRESHKQGQGQA